MSTFRIAIYGASKEELQGFKTLFRLAKLKAGHEFEYVETVELPKDFDVTSTGKVSIEPGAYGIYVFDDYFKEIPELHLAFPATSAVLEEWFALFAMKARKPSPWPIVLGLGLLLLLAMK